MAWSLSAAPALDAAAAAALFTAGFGLLFLLAVALLYLRKTRRGRAALTLVGREAAAAGEVSPDGYVLVDGELWPARLARGADAPRGCRRFRVVGAEGHWLEVEPLQAPGGE